MGKKAKTLVLIDGNAIIHRSYHALPPLTTKKGELVNAVYGFTTTLLNVLDKFKPDYIIATFDLAGPTFRHEEYKEYKATRVKAPDELYTQIPRVKDVVRAFNIPIYEAKGFEADDVIGTIVKQCETDCAGVENVIVTGDLDTLQLVNEKTKVYTMRRGITDSVIYDEKAVGERYGLKPEQLVDFKGLRGDPSDNILGVKGIGEKTAIELLKEFESVENVYKNLAKIKGATREKLERDKLQAIQSKRLATIRKDAPVKLNLSEAVTHDFNREKLASIMRELEFFSLLKRIPESIRDMESGKGASKPGKDKVSEFKCDIVDEAKMEKYAKHLERQGEIALRLKTVGEKILEREVKGVAITEQAGRSSYVEYSEKNFSYLKDILENPKIKKIGYDLKTDMEALGRYGINLQGLSFDVMLAAYVLNPGSNIDLENLTLSEVGEEMPLVQKKGQLGLEMESQEEMGEKICRVSDYIWKLKKIYEDRIEEISADQRGYNNLKQILHDIEMPLVPILANMEIIGVRMDTVIFEGISKKIESRIKNLEAGIYKLAGKEFNINSPRQLADILFIDLKIPAENIKKLKTGYSTAAMELEKIRHEHKIIEKIEEYREIFKLKTTYLDTLPLLVDEDSRIHTKFNQAVTSTGRLSSSEPNLQNIPIRTEIGQLLRTAFEAQEGWKLISADYSQIDLRVMAHVSGDKKLIELFHKGEDIHRATAALINNVTPSQVTDRMRRGAKELNFGVIYGISPFGFAMRSGIDRSQAKKFIDEYFERFPAVAQYMQKTKEFTKKHLYVETEMGRRRYIPEINSPNFQVQSAAERMAINLPIQGLSADIMKLAMIKVWEEFREDLDIRMILQVHDEIIFEVKEEKARKVAPKIKEIMESVYKLRVPLVADVKMGDNWGEI